MIFCDKILNFVIANDRIRSLRRKSSPLATESDKKWVLWIKMSPGPRFMRYDHFLTGLFWVCTWLKSSKKSIDISKSLGIHSNSPKLARNTRKSSKQSKNNQKSSKSDKKMVSETPTITINRLVYHLVYLFSKISTEWVLGKYISQASDLEVKTNGQSRKNTQNDQRWSETAEIR